MPIFRVKAVKIYTGQKNLQGYIRGIRDKYQVWWWSTTLITGRAIMRNQIHAKFLTELFAHLPPNFLHFSVWTVVMIQGHPCFWRLFVWTAFSVENNSPTPGRINLSNSSLFGMCSQLFVMINNTDHRKDNNAGQWGERWRSGWRRSGHQQVITWDQLV